MYYCTLWVSYKNGCGNNMDSLQHLVSKNKIMRDYLASYQEPNFLQMKSVFMFFLKFWEWGSVFLPKWESGLLQWQIICQIARNISLIVGLGIFIPVKHILPGEEKILEERYLPEKIIKKGGEKGGKEVGREGG